jgi:hypothetical protein
VPGSGINAETLATGKPVETSRHNGAISVLIGHVVAAKTNEFIASDESMGVPEDWDSPHPKPSNLGHQEAGRTIVIHSVAILPAFQGRGLGRVLMMAYMQQMNGAGIADRLALIAHDVSLNLWLSSKQEVNEDTSLRWLGMRSLVLAIRERVRLNLVVVAGTIWCVA